MNIKFYPLLVVLCASFLVASCKKRLLKHTTISLDASVTTIDIYYPTEAHYLEVYNSNPDALISEYVKRLRRDLSKGRTELVGANEAPEYFLVLNSLKLEETDVSSHPREDFHRISIYADFDLLDAQGQFIRNIEARSSTEDRTIQNQTEEGFMVTSYRYTDVTHSRNRNVDVAVANIVQSIRADR